METTRRRDTSAELAIRRAVWAAGLRYRIDSQVLVGLRRRADMVFRAERLAVFVDGCFWHLCPEHASLPRHNRTWWRAKLRANVKRDTDTNRRLIAAGWAVLRFWEHEDPRDAARKIVRAAWKRSRKGNLKVMLTAVAEHSVREQHETSRSARPTP